MVAASLAGGGAERALLDTAALLTERGHEVTVLTFEGAASDAYAVPACLSRITLGVPAWSGNRLRGVINNLRRITALRREFRRLSPDVVVSYLTRANVVCLLAVLGTGMPVVATEHNVASLNDAPAQVVWRSLRCILYRSAAGVVVVSHGLARQYAWMAPDRLTVIHNFLPVENEVKEPPPGLPQPGFKYVVGMGRLEAEKRFDLLISAFNSIQRDCPEWKLLILGEGSLRSELSELVRSLELTERVELPGRVPHPRAVLRKCDLFVLSSESEGFGLVVVEALAAGLPVISVDCDFGPREILVDGETGILVAKNDVQALSRAMSTLIRSEALRRRLACQGVASLDRFQPVGILNQWESLLADVAGAKPVPTDTPLAFHKVQRP